MTVQLYSIFTIGKHKISIFLKKQHCTQADTQHSSVGEGFNIHFSNHFNSGKIDIEKWGLGLPSTNPYLILALRVWKSGTWCGLCLNLVQ